MNDAGSLVRCYAESHLSLSWRHHTCADTICHCRALLQLHRRHGCLHASVQSRGLGPRTPWSTSYNVSKLYERFLSTTYRCFYLTLVGVQVVSQPFWDSRSLSHNESSLKSDSELNSKLCRYLLCAEDIQTLGPKRFGPIRPSTWSL